MFVFALAAALEGLLDLQEIYEKDVDRKETHKKDNGGDEGLQQHFGRGITSRQQVKTYLAHLS